MNYSVFPELLQDAAGGGGTERTPGSDSWVQILGPPLTICVTSCKAFPKLCFFISRKHVDAYSTGLGCEVVYAA